MMEDQYDDVDGLLEDIENNNDSGLHSRSHWIPSNARLATHQPIHHSLPLRHVPIWQDESSTYGSSYPPLGGFHFQGGLDEYDRSLLAEPGHRTTGRVSLPGPTAPAYSSSPPFPAHNPSRQQYRPCGPPPKEFSITMSRNLRTPPAQYHDLSPTMDTITSSPTFRIHQRRYGPQRTQPHTQSKPPPNVGKRRSSYVDRDLECGPSFNGQAAKQICPSGPEAQSGPGYGLPNVQGIQIVPTADLPDRFRSVFQFPVFNAIQSKCYSMTYLSDDNLVVSAPTGGGKTAILELAICRLVAGLRTDQFKAVYLAPTKSLCSERRRDWQSKFSTLGLECAELTGDTDNAHLRGVQSAHIIITTPEKWDSVTRKWKDHMKLIRMVRLVLIDEVHILKDVRGATLEAVVSRMKSVGSSIRFVALSATVPNSDDIATWLGKNPGQAHLPAMREVFGEEFRPVKLQKHVVGLPYRGNDFGFENACDPVLPNIIAKHSSRKPIMVFCMTRKSTVTTAKLLADSWAKRPASQRCWDSPRTNIRVADTELRATVTSGVAFHHAGLDSSDRAAVEMGFLEGNINVICCTSTLAVGVNLPCHFVIIKNTVCYQDQGIKEYSDLEIIQMLGRAGRPQFDRSAVAVIITKQEKASKYEKLITGQELLESSLHLNLIEHLNAEIGLGTVNNIQTAKRWLSGTFLHVRLGKNPNHYRVAGDTVHESLEGRLEAISKRDLGLLEEVNLITSTNDSTVKATEFGDIMARYYVSFESMKLILGLNHQPRMSDILSALVQAEEYHDVRLRGTEKKLFKEINRQSGIKFPIRVDLAVDAHKRSLIIQAELGCIDFPADKEFSKFKTQYLQEKARIFTNIHRLIRSVIDCQIQMQDAVGVRNALELARSLSARVWDNSPYQMKQIPQIGGVAVRKLALGGIASIEALEMAESHRIEMLLSKNPPFGSKIVASVQAFPKLRVSIKSGGKQQATKGRPPVVKIEAEWGFMNEKPVDTFQRRPVYLCLVTERSDGLLVDFRRMPARNIINGQEALMTVELLNQSQSITCYVMCDGIAGTLRRAELKPDLPAYLFTHEQPQQDQMSCTESGNHADIVHHGGAHTVSRGPRAGQAEFGDNDLDESILQGLADGGAFTYIDDFKSASGSLQTSGSNPHWSPEKLGNGKWACNHRCQNKQGCKHLCCREGVEKKPKPPKNAVAPTSALNNAKIIETHAASRPKKLVPKGQTTLSTILAPDGKTGTVDLTSPRRPLNEQKSQVRHLPKLKSLHNSINRDNAASPISPYQGKSANGNAAPKLVTGGSGDVPDTFEPSTDYSDGWAHDWPSITEVSGEGTAHSCATQEQDMDVFGLDDGNPPSSHDLPRSELEVLNSDRLSENEDASIGLNGSANLQRVKATKPPQIDLHGSNSDKLFFSTDSPEKAFSPQLKRHASDIDQDPTQTAVSEPKRLKSHATGDPEPPSEGEQKLSSGTVIKPGLPAWVYRFDPTFVAEYQDFVEFV